MSSVFILEKNVIYFSIKGDLKDQIKHKKPSKIITKCKLIKAPEERIVLISQKELYYQKSKLTDEFTLIAQLSNKSAHCFTDIFINNNNTSVLYILLDSFILIKYNVLSQHINSTDLQKIIDIYEKKANNKKDDNKLIDNFKLFTYKEESTNYQFIVAQNIDLRQFDSIISFVIFPKSVDAIYFKPLIKEKDNRCNNELIVCHHNEILIFDDSSMICIKRIKYLFNTVKHIQYSSDGRFLFVALDDNYVYGINDKDNKCEFCLEGHNNYVTDLLIRKVKVPSLFNYSQSKPNDNTDFSSFKLISFDDYLKDCNSDEENDISEITDKMNKINVNESSKDNSNLKTGQEIYEIITAGRDGMIGFWLYKPNEEIKELNLNEEELKPPWDSNINKTDTVFNFPQLKEIKLIPALNSKNYIFVRPLELKVLNNRPLRNLLLLNSTTLLTTEERGKNNNELFINLYQYTLNTKNYYVKQAP